MNVYAQGLLAAASYPPFKAGIFLQTFTSDTVTVGYSLDTDGTPHFAFAGTRDVRDVIDDLSAWPEFYPGVGRVAAGFFAGMSAMYNTHLKPLCVNGKVDASGHSLGCSHASIFAALCARDGIRIRQLVLLEPPRPGYGNHADIVRRNCDRVYGFKNARDPVPRLPVPILGMDWQHIVPLVELNNTSPGINPIDDHLLAAVMPGLERWQEMHP